MKIGQLYSTELICRVFERLATWPVPNLRDSHVRQCFSTEKKLEIFEKMETKYLDLILLRGDKNDSLITRPSWSINPCLGVSSTARVRNLLVYNSRKETVKFSKISRTLSIPTLKRPRTLSNFQDWDVGMRQRLLHRYSFGLSPRNPRTRWSYRAQPEAPPRTYRNGIFRGAYEFLKYWSKENLTWRRI